MLMGATAASASGSAARQHLFAKQQIGLASYEMSHTTSTDARFAKLRDTSSSPVNHCNQSKIRKGQTTPNAWTLLAHSRRQQWAIASS
jgi:hypothetical protein